MYMKNSKGSTLLEVLVSLALVLFVVTALTITTINGLKNSQFSQNQLQATKFAQEGVEQVKQARARNCPVKFTADTTPYVWYGPGTQIWVTSFTVSPPRQFKFATSENICSLDQVTSGEVLAGKFKREILIEDSGTDKKEVIVKVSWTDFSGAHETKNITILSEEY